MNVFPFFIECSKHYQDEPHKQKFLQKLAFGHGIHIIKRKDKNILVTANGEFTIPTVYSDKALKDLAGKLWEVNDFTRLGDCVEDMRQTWHTARKKDKIYLLYKLRSGASRDHPISEEGRVQHPHIGTPPEDDQARRSRLRRQQGRGR